MKPSFFTRIFNPLARQSQSYSFRPIVRPPGQQQQYLERLRHCNPKVYHIFKGLAKNESTKVSNTTEKHMHDSYVEEFLRFRSNPTIKEDYVNHYGSIRIGKLLEDLDALAGSISYLHCSEGEGVDVIIVTASVDRIDLLQKIPPDKDLKLSGHVTCTDYQFSFNTVDVGTSSMEVALTLESCVDDAPPVGSERIGRIQPQDQVKQALTDPFPILEAKFIMVALDKNSFAPSRICPLRLETEAERELFSLAAHRKAVKAVSKQISLETTPPSVEEMIQIHKLYLEYIQYLDPSYNKSKPENVIWMKDTIQQSIVLCMPQDRNIHNKIFGGFLMKLAFELAYSTGYIFCKSRISFVALDDITFKQAVSIGSLLSLTSQVTFSKGSPSNCFQVKVKADVIDPIAGLQATTNTFHFTFQADSVPRVIPRSYDETIRYLEGQRKQKEWKRHVSKGFSQP